MKTRKIIGLFLVLSMVLSMFTVFAAADEPTEPKPEEKEDLTVIYNRSFDEGWNFKNGLSFQNSASDLRIDYEYGYDMMYNYYLCAESLGGGKNDIFYLKTAGEDRGKGKLFMEFDIKVSENANLGDIITLVTKGSGSAREFTFFINIENGHVNVLGKDIGPCFDDWAHIGMIFDWDYDDPSGEFPLNYTITAVYDNPNGESDTIVVPAVAGAGGKGIQEFRIGFTTGMRNLGWFGLDNLKLYNGVSNFTEIPKDDYGKLVNSSAVRDMPIIGNDLGADNATLGTVKDESLIMKKGVSKCIMNGDVNPILEKDGVIYGAPTEVNGELMISLETLLKYINYPYFIHPDGQSFDISTGTSATYLTVGRKSATVGGKRVNLNVAPGYVENNGQKFLAIALSDVDKLFPGFYASYENIGLVAIAKYPDILSKEKADYNTMVALMMRFIFDFASEEEVYEMAKKNTNNFTHPYMFANQGRFDELRDVYYAEEGSEKFNEELKSYIQPSLDTAANFMKSNAGYSEDGKYIGIKEGRKPINHNYEKFPDGYDVGGRCHVPAGQLPSLAVAYQITKDTDYVRMAYDWILALGEWPHWGSAHFLNCADSSSAVATAIDWMYPGMIEAGLNPAKVISVLYKNGVHPGYLGTTGQPNPFAMNRLFRDASHYTERTNNWNAVCTSGMVISALAMMGERGTNYKKETTLIVSSNPKTLMRYGMGQYIPDGSYVESASYWEYGTNNFFEMAWALDSVLGTDFRVMECWGIDRTCYFACQAEDSNFHSYSYHDGNTQEMDTSFFPYVGLALKDMNLVKIRRNQLRNGKRGGINDAILYVPDSELKDVDLPLEYYMEGIDGFTMRSSWEKDSMYAGIMGGANNASHGQVDCGSFVYHNKGKIWITDLGGDNYNVINYFGDYHYYKKTAEGNNTLCMTSVESLDLGQKLTAAGHITETYSNDFGTYVIIDNTDVFDGKATYWNRGMMATNDRKTVIVQDEVSLKGIQTIWSFLHYNTDIVEKVEISADGRTAYMTSHPDKHGKTEKIRISIVSPSLDFKFQLMDTYQFVLSATHEPGYSESKGGQPEHKRNQFLKLAVVGENVLSFNLSYVIEALEPNQELGVGYEWTKLDDWEPYADNRNSGEIVEVLKRKAAKRIDIVSNIKKAEGLKGHDVAFGDDLEKYYRTLCDLEFACLAFAQEDLTDELIQNYRKKDKLLKEYESFRTAVNQNRITSNDFVNSIMGI